ncbi:hypothetical protein [Azohydromonas aeria]|uniref:hypothetical protein n=1 Tax=Azohydromonas aeria TaxID=2590212 RepID=UPI0012FC91B4|nr:hypothetical protein [Azohydromonas aeria]
MKFSPVILLAACAATHAGIPNEAVRTMPDGRVVVEQPPGPKWLKKSPPRPKEEIWTTGYLRPSFLIETERGWQECPQLWVDSSCREYVPGRDKRMRTWVLKVGGQWRTCPTRDAAAGCRDYYSPLPAGSYQQ